MSRGLCPFELASRKIRLLAVLVGRWGIGPLRELPKCVCRGNSGERDEAASPIASVLLAPLACVAFRDDNERQHCVLFSCGAKRSVLDAEFHASDLRKLGHPISLSRELDDFR